MLTLYGIHTCTTVKKARAWLEQNGVIYQYHDLRRDGLNAELLQTLLSHTAWAHLLNRTSTTWRQLSAEQRADLNADKAFALMLANPTLIKRPVLLGANQFILGFDVERYQSLL
jgi:Spx/MgsR family transcriptional regulator